MQPTVGSSEHVTAIADTLADRVGVALEAVGQFENKVDVPEERRFTAVDGYRPALDHCDLVILATHQALRLPPFMTKAA